MNILFTPPKNKPGGFGPLYNWFTVTDARSIYPEGWHVASQAEIQETQLYLDPTIIHPSNPNISGGKMKEIGNIHWDAPNIDATNEANFNARATGTRADDHDINYAGTFDGNIRIETKIWTSTEYDAKNAWCFVLDTWSGNLYCWNNYGKTGGLSIRLVKNSTTLIHGQKSTMIDHEGRIYPTICIGNKEWLGEHYACRKFGNGDWVSGFDGGIYTPISNEDWILRGNAGESLMCVYENDLLKM